MTKKERKRARHARRVASRAIAKKGREIGDILVTNLFTPRKALVPIASIAPSIAPPRYQSHPTWDTLLNHIGDIGIRSWVAALKRPSEPLRPLLLTGPENSGKTMFHEAMKLLLPKDSVIHPWDLRDLKSWLILRGVWMLVVESCPPYYVHILGNSRQEPNRDGHYLRWCLTNRDRIEEPSILQFNLRPPTLLIPKADMIRRLEDERDAFQSTLLRAA